MAIPAEGIQRRVLRILRSRKTPLWIAAIAVVANLEVLSSGLFSDDYFHLASIAFRLTGVPVEGHWWEIYGVPTARGLSVPNLVQRGMLPWWTSQDYSTAFLRPLAVATHYFDAVCLHAHAVWTHAHNLLWYAVLVLLVGYSHRRFSETPYVSALATFLYAVDEAHSEGLAWIAGRNTIMSACAVVAALLVHDDSRRNGSAFSKAGASAIFGLGLAAGEGGAAAWAYLFAYALILDQGTCFSRLRSLIPYLLITMAWLGLYRVGGYGARGGAIYLDPLRDPIGFVSVFPTRFSLLWLELTTLPNTIYDFIAVEFARPLRILTFCLCFLLTSLCLRLAFIDKIARFWLVGALLSLLPFCGVASGARLLFVPGVGTTALLSLLVGRMASGLARTGKRAVPAGAGGRIFVISACGLLHVVGAVWFIPFKIETVDRQNSLLRALASSLPVHGEAANRSTVFVLNTATYLFSLLTPFGRAAEDRVEALYIFGAAHDACSVGRLSRNQLRLDCPSGFLGEPSATFVRSPRAPFQLGEAHRVGPAELRVVALDEHGAATSVAIELENMDDPRWVWTYWDGSSHGYRRLIPPPVGMSTPLPAMSTPQRAETDLWL